MRKTSFILPFLCIILLCACGKESTPAPSATPAPAVITPPPATEAPAETPAPTPETTPEVFDERFVGTWCISRTHNEYAALLEFFGTSLRELGSGLDISVTGSLSYYIGSSGGEGSWISDGDTAHAETQSERFSLTLTEIDGETFLEMNFGGVSIIWQRAE